MTTMDGTLASPADATAPMTVARRPRIWLRLLVGFAFGFLISLGIAAGALYAYDASFEARVLPGVRVGGVDLSGLDRGQAAAALDAAFAGYGDGRVVVQTTAGDVVVPYATFARRADTAAMVEAALQVGRSGTVLERAVAEVRLALDGASLEPRLMFDPAALAATVQARLSALELAPIDSRVTLDAGVVSMTAARDGRAFDGTAAIAAALDTVGRIDAPAEVVVEADVTRIPPRHGVNESVAAKDAAESMMSAVVLTRGDDEWTIKAKTVKSWLRFETGADGSARPTVDEAAVAASLKKVAKAVRLDPVSAKYLKTRNGRIVGVAAAKNGRKLDTAATAAAIARALEARGAGAAAEPVKVEVTKIAPKLTTEEATKKGPLMSVLGTWKTWFPINDHNYFGANIWQPAKIIDGTVLRPGQRFEWWSAIGTVSPARGFGPGGFIAGDHTEPTGALGGGMCSSSTTLFNAALRAGLQIGARSNHKYYIYRYPLGLDATVSKTRGGGSQTMSFTNDMKTPIVIRTYRYRAGGKGWVKYEIWGIPDGRRVSLSKPSVSNVQKAVTKTVPVSTLPKGVREQTEFPANGMDVSVTRTVRNSKGKVIHGDTFRTHYVLWNGRIEVGT